jgi:hypothetical protein
MTANDTGHAALVSLLRLQGVAAEPVQLHHQLGMAGKPVGVAEMLRCARQLRLKRAACRRGGRGSRTRAAGYCRTARWLVPAGGQGGREQGAGACARQLAHSELVLVVGERLDAESRTGGDATCRCFLRPPCGSTLTLVRDLLFYPGLRRGDVLLLAAAPSQRAKGNISTASQRIARGRGHPHDGRGPDFARAGAASRHLLHGRLLEQMVGKAHAKGCLTDQ